MAITQVREIWSGRASDYDERLSRNYTRTFRVMSDAVSEDPIVVEFAAGIPRVWSTYVANNGTYDDGALCRKVRAEQQDEDPCEWRVTCEYSSRSVDPALVSAAGGSSGGGSGDSGPVIENPLLRPAQVAWGTIHDTWVLDQSYDTPPKPIRNSAKQPFTPRPTIDWNRPTITIVRNEATFRRALLSYIDTVNSGPWNGFGARTVKIQSITGKRQFENNILFWEVTYQLEVRYPDWDLHLIDQGSSVLRTLPLTGVTVPIPITDGLPMSGAALLDGSGQLKTGTDPTILDFRAYPERVFSELGLPLV